ncbi:MAG: adenosylcobinamide-GDP ribazoletransferase [Chitinophagales bacterium]|nr:adenosylcobinamide-GDP ribazoletransferase [Chitinophagales bacterium]
MKKELKVFFTALLFYTRIPCPSWADHSQENLNKATRYFPFIGWIVGTGAAVVFGLSSLIFPVSISVVLAMITGVLMTGAFHEDGFADTCDGFGGGWTKEKILDIMKDSRSGAYGVIGSILLLLLKFSTLVELGKSDIWFCISTIILANTLSRFAAVFVTFTEKYVREDELSKAKPIAKKLSTSDFIISSLWLIPAFLLFKNPMYLLVLIPVFLMTIYLKRYFKKWIGGYTGDCLGATQQINEVVILLSCLALWKFI